MNIKAFFVDALGGALDLGIGTPDDVLRHVTPELLARHLPRPLWARLFTACLGAPRVDAQLVIETIGVPNLCEHIPGAVIWKCLAEIGARSLGRTSTSHASAAVASTPPPPPAAPVEKRSVLSPPPDVMADPSDPGGPVTAVGPSLPSVSEPLADLISELEQDDRPSTPSRTRSPTGQRFRQSGTNTARLGTQQRRPQAAAAAPGPNVPPPPGRSERRGSTEVSEHDVETSVNGSEWRDKKELVVDDSQLVDWQSTETTQATTDEDFSDIGRKR